MQPLKASITDSKNVLLYIETVLAMCNVSLVQISLNLLFVTCVTTKGGTSKKV